MKKTILVYSTLSSLLFLASCSSNTDKQAVSVTEFHTDNQAVAAIDDQKIAISDGQDVAMAGIQDVAVDEDYQEVEGEVEIDVKSSTARHHFNQSHRHYPAGPRFSNAATPIIKASPELTNAQRFSGVLSAHNNVRIRHGLTPLKWSSKLAQYSQQWANHLGAGSQCKIAHRGGIPPYGENLYRASSLRWSDGKTELLPVTIKNVVKAWTDEEKWYDYARNRCQPGQKCGHYTQIVWRDTTEVGCAVKICADKSQTWVCSYNPPGNYQGVKPY